MLFTIIANFIRNYTIKSLVLFYYTQLYYYCTLPHWNTLRDIDIPVLTKSAQQSEQQQNIYDIFLS